MPKRMWTKMGSENKWKEKAREYYSDGLKITDIEALLGVSRKSISTYLKSLPDYEQIKDKRRKESDKRRREYKTKKQKDYRSQNFSAGAVTTESIRREHELAVMELSREKYH